MKRHPEWLLGTVTVAMTVAICVVVAEVVLRFLPVASSLYTVPVTAQNPVFHFTPNRDFVYSRDWDMVLANRGHVNNAGFVNDQDYQKDGSLPMLKTEWNSSHLNDQHYPGRTTLPRRLIQRPRKRQSRKKKLAYKIFQASGSERLPHALAKFRTRSLTKSFQ